MLVVVGLQCCIWASASIAQIERKDSSSYNIIEKLLQEQQFLEAVIRYDSAQPVRYSEALNDQMLGAIKAVGKPKLGIIISRFEQKRSERKGYWQMREMQFLMYDNQFIAARKVAATINSTDPDFVELLSMLQVNANDWGGYLFQQIERYKTNPNNETAQAFFLALIKLRAPYGAATQSLVPITAMNQSQAHALLQAKAGKWLNWSNALASTASMRVAMADSALYYLDQVVADSANVDTATRAYVDYDRIIAYATSFRFSKALQVYNQARKPVPNYAKIYAANAALESRKPELALQYYNEVLQSDSSSIEAIIGKSYTLSDLFKHQDNLQFLQHYLEKWPVRVWSVSENKLIPNPKRQAIAIQYAKSLEYASNPSAAHKVIQALKQNMPMDKGLYQVEGNILAAMGHKDDAGEAYAIAYANNQSDAGLLYNIAGNYYARFRFEEMHKILQQLEQSYQFDPVTARLRKEWKEFMMQQMNVNAELSSRFGPVQDGAGYFIETAYTSRPFGKGFNWQLIGAFKYEAAEIPEGVINYRRFSGGVRYRYNRLQVDAQLQYFDSRSNEPAGVIAIDYRLSDKHAVATGFEKISSQQPIRGLYYNITNDRWYGFYVYRPDERTSAKAGLSHFWFSDNNKRLMADFSLDRRLYFRPRWRLDGNLMYYYSKNSQQGGPYFNPISDHAINFNLEAKHTIYQRYEFAFNHALDLALTNYYQRGFDPGWVRAIQYQQVIDFNYRSGLKWSFISGNRIFDGVKEPYYVFQLGGHVKL